tara:strand:- start:1129 stop:1740 length:612 start_codon:yes stop_codon:yes gene_type:complete
MFNKMEQKYKKVKTSNGEIIKGLLLLKPSIFYDERGFFLESWNKKDFQNLLENDNQEKVELVQDNHSKSKKGVLRGLHFQRDPHAQGKLIRCISGSIFDAVLDLRKESKTFGKWASITLSSENLDQLWIPKGFAHGFLTLSNTAEINYKTTDYWYKEYEISILWNDSNININWPLEKINSQIVINQKDKNAKMLPEINKEFLF